MSPTVPDGYSARPPTMADVGAVTALYNVCSMAELGAPETSVADLCREWQTPGFDLERDAWLVAAPGRHAVGYIDVWSQAPFTRIYGSGCVHPVERGRGIGAYLLQVQETRAREIMAQAPAEACVSLVNRALSTNERARRLLERAGFRVERHFWRMAITFDAPPPAPVWPDGLTVRAAVAGQDERALYEALDEAFQDHYDHQSFPFDTWLHWLTSDQEQYDPSLWFLALEDDEVAGVVICRPRLAGEPDMGWVDDLGVRRPWRRQGLGQALLRQAFGALYQRGTRTVGLSVDAASLTGATRLYERTGMRIVRQYDRYAKELRPGDAVNQ
jgi:mycothiol synthase